MKLPKLIIASAVTLSLLLPPLMAKEKNDQVVKIGFKFELLLVDSFNGSVPFGTIAYSIYEPGHCVIVMKKDKYPQCLQHELRHCLEGDWHGKFKSMADCHVDEATGE